MNEVVFVTHNKGKIAEAQKILDGINLKIFEHEVDEPRSDDIKFISKHKVMEAYKLVNKPCNRKKYGSVNSIREFAKWYKEQTF